MDHLTKRGLSKPLRGLVGILLTAWLVMVGVVATGPFGTSPTSHSGFGPGPTLFRELQTAHLRLAQSSPTPVGLTNTYIDEQGNVILFTRYADGHANAVVASPDGGAGGSFFPPNLAAQIQEKLALAKPLRPPGISSDIDLAPVRTIRRGGEVIRIYVSKQGITRIVSNYADGDVRTSKLFPEGNTESSDVNRYAAVQALSRLALILLTLLVLPAVLWALARNKQRGLAAATSLSSLYLGILYGVSIARTQFGNNPHPWNGVIYLAVVTFMGASAYFLRSETSETSRRVSLALGLLMMLSSLSIGASLFFFAIPGALLIGLGLGRGGEPSAPSPPA